MMLRVLIFIVIALNLMSSTTASIDPEADAEQAIYKNNKELFYYVKDYCLEHDVSLIHMSSREGNPLSKDQVLSVAFHDGKVIPIHEVEDRIFAESVMVLFDDYGYEHIMINYLYSQERRECMFIKGIADPYRNVGISFSEIDDHPVRGTYFAVERLEEGWFYFDRDLKDGIDLPG